MVAAEGNSLHFATMVATASCRNRRLHAKPATTAAERCRYLRLPVQPAVSATKGWDIRLPCQPRTWKSSRPPQFPLGRSNKLAMHTSSALQTGERARLSLGAALSAPPAAHCVNSARAHGTATARRPASPRPLPWQRRWPPLLAQLPPKGHARSGDGPAKIPLATPGTTRRKGVRADPRRPRQGPPLNAYMTRQRPQGPPRRRMAPHRRQPSFALRPWRLARPAWPTRCSRARAPQRHTTKHPTKCRPRKTRREAGGTSLHRGPPALWRRRPEPNPQPWKRRRLSFAQTSTGRGTRTNPNSSTIPPSGSPLST
mmetsp:Transcript_89525/g.252234  ORF Transcript_89525/g.252234 Transcript_89525/m.252234 type:complete len:313 (+) Transcript_89525:598-1536(+)